MIFRIMLNSKCGIIGEAPHENLHIIRHYAKLQLIDFMANITSEGLVAATVTLSIIPIVILYPFVARFMVQGITVGSVKG